MLDCNGFAYRFFNYVGALREQLLSTIASKVDAKINAEKVVRIQAKMFEKYANIDWGSMKIHRKTREKSMILRDLQNLDFCDTSAVKT